MLRFRAPVKSDGEAMWRLVSRTDALDDNSPYAYLMMCHDFRETCIVAEDDGDVVGFIAGYRPPTRQNTLFVWQIGVSAKTRGQGVGRRMILALLRRLGSDGVRFLEATVTPSNQPSQGLFRSVAEHLNAPCLEREEFPAALFPNEESHESEILFRIGPFAPPSEVVVSGKQREAAAAAGGGA